MIVNFDDEEGKGTLQVTEYLLRDAAFFRVLWNGIMQTENFDKATLGLSSFEIKRERNGENEGRNTEKIRVKMRIRIKICVKVEIKIRIK